MVVRRSRPDLVWVTCAALAVVVALPSCTFLVSDDPIRCFTEAGAPDPCPEDRTCVSGFCVPAPTCTGSTELCNGRDDDCDQRVDEGHDDDGDGFTWCGGGATEEVDCDDSRADVHPGSLDGTTAAAPETCDARDNDCDMRVDESPSTLCDGGEQCFPGVGCAPPNCTLPGFECNDGDSCDVSQTPAVCVVGVCTPTSCAAPMVCDPRSGSCVHPMPLDSPCTISAQCAEGACMPAAALTGGTGSVCAASCCRDSECPVGRVCWASPRGGRACVLPSAIGSATGPGALGSACTRSDECGSSRCLEGYCREACTGPPACNAPQSCVLLHSEDIAPEKVLACAMGPGGAPVGESCATDPCASGLCVDRVEAGGPVCLGGCRTTADCPAELYCGGLLLGQGTAATNLQACLPRIHSGGGITGDACSNGWSCRDLACIGQRCADTCCNDAQCPASAACVPVSRGRGAYEMRCVPRW